MSVAQTPALPSPLLLIEDEPVMHLRLRAILEDLGYAEDAISIASDIASARSLLASQAFAIVLVDVGLPDGNGVDVIRELHARDASLPILVISAWSTEQIIMQALQAGASGYLLKERDDIELSLSIRSTLRGGAPIDPFVAKRILALARVLPVAKDNSEPSRPQLTARETEILHLVAKGLTNREISGTISLSRLTVESHVKNIYRKLAVGSRTEAVFEGRVHGLLN